MEQEKIIPTRSKKKLRLTLSYPVGAKAISEALIGVPQFDELTLVFWFYNQQGSRSTVGGPFSVLEAEFSGPLRSFSASMDMVEKGYHCPKWTITVYAIPRSLRHLIQGKILSKALPSVRSWLIANPHSIEREGYNAISFSFDELKSELTSKKRMSIQWQTARIDRP
jgi:hypothetical protein